MKDMSSVVVVAVLMALRLPLSSASKMRITPVQKVLDMMSEMQAKGEQTMEAEQKIFAEYKEWVSDRTTELGFEIKTAEADIERLIAFAEKADNKVAQLGEAIAGLDGDLDRLTAEKKDATDVRSSEHAEYLKISQDYSESVDALTRAIQTLSQESYDRPQAEALLQRMAADGSPAVRRALALALPQEEASQDGAPAVAAYKFQSSSILELLDSLLTKFKTQLDDVETQESNQAHYYDLELLHLNDVIAKSTSDRQKKAAFQAETAAASAKAKGQLAQTKAALAESQKFLADTKATFEAKSATFVANQQVRKDELTALGKALEIISSPSVAESYAGHVKLTQLSSSTRAFTSLLQTRSSKRRVAARQRAAEYLTKSAGRLSSEALASLAAEVAANPFAKVVEMIEGLLARLKEEAAAEAEHKAWCDEQLKNNKIKRETKTARVEELIAQIQEITGQIESMGKEIETLAKEQAELTKAMGEATEQRTKEKAENLATIADAKAGSAAVKQALEILQEFYSSQASLLQSGEHQVPELAEYKGLQGNKGGIIGMLEVIDTDFMRLDAETTAAEAEAAKQYDAFMSDAKADKLQKHNQEYQLSLDKDQAEFEKSQLKKDLAANEDELQKANTYFEYLKPNCLQIHVSYEERAARRKEEIAALKEAYGILNSKSID
mmetsp:Transcript_108748/g.232398  ORF Transcript_108748/g.232398 Transcript_108748/m.232398 type:complete len:670 (+) Transcript_108748:108-2117(+)